MKWFEHWMNRGNNTHKKKSPGSFVCACDVLFEAYGIYRCHSKWANIQIFSWKIVPPNHRRHIKRQDPSIACHHRKHKKKIRLESDADVINRVRYCSHHITLILPMFTICGEYWHFFFLLWILLFHALLHSQWFVIVIIISIITCGWVSAIWDIG